MAGIGASSTTLDLEMFDIDHRAGVHREMIAESISMMLRFWESEAPLEIRGKYWTVRGPADQLHRSSKDPALIRAFMAAIAQVDAHADAPNNTY
ncbi:hypothetical protein I7824_14815 [Burkholderia seminalis]|nr:hypothetical protein [Burkholderia seminalis]